MERLTGTQYTYTKTRVAYLVPFIFLVPGLVLGLVIAVLNARPFQNGLTLPDVSAGTKWLIGVLLLVGIYISRDLWLTFIRTVSEQIWVTDREIVWVGRHKQIRVVASHFEIKALRPIGGDIAHAWMFEIQTTRGNIRFTRSLEHANELIARVQSFLAAQAPVVE